MYYYIIKFIDFVGYLTCYKLNCISYVIPPDMPWDLLSSYQK
jgi:hypothetical protein